MVMKVDIQGLTLTLTHSPKEHTRAQEISLFYHAWGPEKIMVIAGFHATIKTKGGNDF